MLNFFLLLDVNATDSLLKECMSEKSIQAGNTYVEHIDLRKNCVIADNAPEHKLSGYTESDTLILDILNTVGVKAYVYASVFTILKPFKSRLIWLAVLTLAEVGCLFWLLRSLFRQEREKKERVRFMLTAMDEINGMASNAEKEMNHLSKILKRE